MIKWAMPQCLYLLLIVPIIIVTIVINYLRRRASLRKFSDEELIPQLTDSVNHRLRHMRSFFFVVGLGFLIVAAARPKWGERPQIYKGKGIDVVIALDASNSMLSQDIGPDRLTRAKTEIAALLDNTVTNQVGITAFAGDCYVMCPLTTDIEAAKLFLDIISPDVVLRPGTNLETAILVSSSLFNPEEQTHKALIIFTDGDNLEGNPIYAVERVAEQGVRLFIVGIGTPEGSVIPELDKNGDFTGYKKDEEDKFVLSRLEERSLIILARVTDGRYFRAEGLYLNRLVDELEKIEKKELREGRYVEYQERYQYFLMVAFLSILMALILNDRKGSWYFKIVFILLGIFTANSGFATVGSSMRRGNSLCGKEKYEEALKNYQEALVVEPDNPKIHYNIGRALYRMEEYDEAICELELGLLSKDREFQAWNLYNMGNCHFEKGELDAAISAYQNTLLLGPNDVEAKQNLEFCLKLEQELQNQAESDSLNQKEPQDKEQTEDEHEPQQQQQLQPQPEEGEMDKEAAARILQALEGKEQENLKKSRERREKEHVEKDW